MKEIPSNFPKPNIVTKCLCEMKEDMVHNYNCVLLNNGKQNELKYENIYSGTLLEQIEIFRIFESNFERREILKHEAECKDMTPRDPSEIHCTRIVMD